jgi:histidinol-phosphate aminotransferase
MKIRNAFKTFQSYGWETPSWEIAARFGLKPEQIVRLDTNTSPYQPKAALRALARGLATAGVNEYPDTSYRGLLEGLSDYTGKSLDRFVVTNGADEGLDIVAKVFIDPGDEVIVATPTYSMYRIVSQIMGGRVRQVARKQDFSVDVDGVLKAFGPRTRAIFLCNPNNPTGNFTPIGDVERLARETDVPIVIDEAYFEICGKTAVDLTDSYENVIVCRTLSKAFSMAGVRVGYLVAKKETAEKLNVVRPPNSLSVISIMLGEAALSNLDEMRRNVRLTLRERHRLFDGLGTIERVEPYPSETNFILFRLKGVKAGLVHEKLIRKGLVLRHLDGVRGVENCLRTTVSTKQVNERLLSELSRAVAG